MAVNPLNDNYPRVSPFLMVADINEEVEFMKNVFDALEQERIELPDGTVRHVEMRIGDSVIMLGHGPDLINDCMMYIYVENTHATYEKALKHGATPLMPPGEQYYGDINAGIRDPSGHSWWIATHFEDVGHEELNRRAAEFETK